MEKRGKEETLGMMDVYYLDCGDGFMGVCVCSNASNCIHSIGAAFCISIIPQ